MSAIRRIADSNRTSPQVRKVPIPEVVKQSDPRQLAGPSRVSISSRNKVKSSGLVSNPMAPFAIVPLGVLVTIGDYNSPHGQRDTPKELIPPPVGDSPGSHRRHSAPCLPSNHRSRPKLAQSCGHCPCPLADEHEQATPWPSPDAYCPARQCGGQSH